MSDKRSKLLAKRTRFFCLCNKQLDKAMRRKEKEIEERHTALIERHKALTKLDESLNDLNLSLHEMEKRLKEWNADLIKIEKVLEGKERWLNEFDKYLKKIN